MRWIRERLLSPGDQLITVRSNPLKLGWATLDKRFGTLNGIRCCDKIVLHAFRFLQRLGVVRTKMTIDQGFTRGDRFGRRCFCKASNVVTGSMHGIAICYPVYQTNRCGFVGSDFIAHPQQIERAADAHHARQ
jgi:hypothetical protein